MGRGIRAHSGPLRQPIRHECQRRRVLLLRNHSRLPVTQVQIVQAVPCGVRTTFVVQGTVHRNDPAAAIQYSCRVRQCPKHGRGESVSLQQIQAVVPRV
jgi:hypothetical protein